MHYDKIGSGYVNTPVQINIQSDSKIKYNFSHSVLTNGKSFDEFVKQNRGSFKLSITPRILDKKYIDNDNALIVSNSGLYLFNVSASELTLLKESIFDSRGNLVSYYSEIVSIDADTVKLNYGKVVSQRDASNYYATPFKSDEERASARARLSNTKVSTFIIDTKNKKIINL